MKRSSRTTNRRNHPPVICPTCRKRGDWFAGNGGPFSSHRCKLIDLGKWFEGEQVISEPLPAGPMGGPVDEVS
jgi:endogenous inhibitor of DNA gyrase (YacG/DUF329 family)